jgi:hypothetical protein
MKTTFLLSAFVLSSVFLSYGQFERTTTNLIEPKCQMGSTSLGSKAYFAGGANSMYYLPKVEIYDVKTQKWSTENLSLSRQFPAGVSCGSKVFFAGGVRLPDGNVYDIVDIYDTITQQWTVAHLSEPRFGVSALAKDNKVLFAGGTNLSTGSSSAVVDIYDIHTELWSTASLSKARGAMGAAVVGDLALFAGGFDLHNYFNQVDIYNFTTNTWSTSTLPQARGFVAAAAVGNKVLIAGGMTNPNDSTSASARVDIYDATTGYWSTLTSALSFKRAFVENGATVNNKACFAGGGNIYGAKAYWTSSSNIIDIYDDDDGTWSVLHLSNDIVNHSVTAVGDYLLVAGGISFSLDALIKQVEIYHDTCSIGPGTTSFSAYETNLKLFPNPASNSITIEHPVTGQKIDGIFTIYGNAGQQVMRQKANGLKSEIDVADLPSGVYFVKLDSNNKITSGKFVKN